MDTKAVCYSKPDLLMSLTKPTYVNHLNYKITGESVIKVPSACPVNVMSLTQSSYANFPNYTITNESIIKVHSARYSFFEVSIARF